MKVKRVSRVLAVVLILCLIMPMTTVMAADNIAYPNAANPSSATLTAIDGSTATLAANGRPKVLLFVGTDCGNSQSVHMQLSKLGISDYADVVVMALNGSTGIGDFASNNSVISGAKYCADDNSTAFTYYRLAWSGNSFTMPLTVVIDSSNKVQMVATAISGVVNAVKSTLGITDSASGEDGRVSVNTPTTETQTWNSYEWEVLKLTNKARMDNGLQPLSMTELMQKAAHIRADELTELYSHNRPNGEQCFTVIYDLGIPYSSLAENIAAGYRTPGDVMNGWLNSSGHYANIMGSSFTHYGGGYLPQGAGSYATSWIQFFLGAGCSFSNFSIQAPSGGFALEKGGSIDSLNAVVQMTCSKHGTSYMPLIEELCTGLDTNTVGTQTVTVKYGTLSKSITVTVADPTPAEPVTYTITASANAGGTVSNSGTRTYNAGDGAVYTFTADAGYYIADVLVDGVSVGAVTSYTFSNISANHTLVVKFARANVTQVAIASLPYKTEYTVGETVDTTGLVLLLTYSDGSFEYVSDGFEVEYDFSTVGTKSVWVTYAELTTYFTVTVQAEAEPGPGDEPTVPSLDNFDANKCSYTKWQFSDVNENSWYGANKQGMIERVVKLGIMEGNGDGTFNPEGSIRLSEALKMAAVVHDIYNGGTGEFTRYGKWYDVYVDYAIANGIIKYGDYYDYNDYASRADMAYIFANALPRRELQTINYIASVPDVNAYTPHYNEIMLLYRAGIVRGNDDFLTFYPYSDVSRAEAAAIISRMILPEFRIKL